MSSAKGTRKSQARPLTDVSKELPSNGVSPSVVAHETEATAIAFVGPSVPNPSADHSLYVASTLPASDRVHTTVENDLCYA